MIKLYELYSTPLGCTVTLGYNDGKLHSFKAENPTFDIATCLEKRYSIYYTEIEFLAAAKKHNVKITELAREITFDMFWDKYNHKSISGKMEAMKAWASLSIADRAGAYDFIKQYDSGLKTSNQSKMHASTYCNRKRWIK